MLLAYPGYPPVHLSGYESVIIIFRFTAKIRFSRFKTLLMFLMFSEELGEFSNSELFLNRASSVTARDVGFLFVAKNQQPLR